MVVRRIKLKSGASFENGSTINASPFIVMRLCLLQGTSIRRYPPNNAVKLRIFMLQVKAD